MLRKFLRTSAFVAAVLAGLQLDAAADPITYEGTLTSGVTASDDLPPGSYYDARGADFWQFWATSGDEVYVAVERVDFDLDPAVWIYKGLYYDTADASLTGGTHYMQDWMPGFLEVADDEIPHPGPFADPLAFFVAPATGWYTAAVTEYLSGPVPNDGSYDYEITVRGATGHPPTQPPSTVPEPTLLALLTCGICGVFVSRRRKAA